MFCLVGKVIKRQGKIKIIRTIAARATRTTTRERSKIRGNAMAERTTTTSRATTIPATREATTVTTKGAASILLGSDQTLVVAIVTKRQRVPATTTTRVRSKKLGAIGTKTTITITTRGDVLLYRKKKKFQGKRLRGVKNVQIASANESISYVT